MDKPKIKSLKEYEGEEVVALIPSFDQTNFQRIRLWKVEDAGIWVESQKMIEVFFSTVKITSAPKTLIFFLPWHEITFVIGALDIPAISETILK